MSAAIDILRPEIGIARHSDWLTVDQAMIDRFADATLDHQFIHVDSERAAETSFGGTIAHGFLILSLLPHLRDSIPKPVIPGARIGINYGMDRLRFVHPARSGSRIRATSTLTGVEERAPGQIQITHDIVVEIADQEKPALVATWRNLIII